MACTIHTSHAAAQQWGNATACWHSRAGSGTTVSPVRGALGLKKGRAPPRRLLGAADPPQLRTFYLLLSTFLIRVFRVLDVLRNLHGLAFFCREGLPFRRDHPLDRVADKLLPCRIGPGHRVMAVLQVNQRALAHG